MSEQPKLTKHKTVREALTYVAKHPDPDTDPIDTPMWELVGRTLFEIALNPDPKVRGAMARATRAQKLLSDRLVGTRRPGTHPAAAKRTQVEFLDLTSGAIGQ